MSYSKVFGIGLNKTGTTSLKIAFKALGFKHLDRTPRLFKAWRQEDWPLIWERAAEFESFEDWPWPLMVPELLRHYGEEARYVLTRRASAEIWVESLKRHAERTNPDRNPRKAIFGHSYPHGAEAAHIGFYNRHLAATRALFEGREHLLLEVCWDEGDGWDAICNFLNRPVPKRTFPVANSSADAMPDPEFLAENQRRIAETRRQ